MPRLSATDNWRLAQLGPHTKRHAQLLLYEFPLLSVSSTYRSPARNRSVGGAVNSYHLTRRAVDFTGSEWDLAAAAGAAWAQRIGKACTGPEEVLLEYLGTSRQHLHVAW